MSASRTLYRKYTVLIGGFVIGALFLAGLVQAYFSYRDSRAAVSALTQEKALAAALRIGDYVKGIVEQIAWVSLPMRDLGGQALLQRRFEFRNLLKQVPAVAEIRQIDRLGSEELLVSRTELDAIATGADYSGDAGFVAARAGALHFSPVYFRKGTEPYARVAVPARREAETVALADINLKFVWESVSRIEVGRTGYAYVIDNTGRLIAHPDLKLVLQNSDFSRLAQIRARGRAVLAQNHAGTNVIAASAPMAATGWSVVVEQPITEAYGPVYASLTRLCIISALSLVLAALGALVIARRIVAPVKALETGAMQLAAGRLDHRVHVKTGDELEMLADQFNAMARSISQSHEGLEQKIEERTRDLALANQAKSHFLAAASHDLRQPMHALGLFVAQLRAKPLLAEQRRLVDRIDISVSAIGALLDSLLDISRLDAGAVSPESADFPVQNLLDRMEDEFMQPAREKGLRFRVVPSRMWVNSDPLLLERIVANLVSNAVRYTQRGRVIVGCRRNGSTLRIVVCDTGRGIPAGEQQRIFAEFYQLANPGHDRSQGLGLGLAIVDRLTRLLGQQVEVRSKIGEGSMFSVTVSRATSGTATQVTRAVETGIPRGTLVALIDDDTLAREGMCGLLSDWGCDVVAAASAAEAVHGLATRNQPPDLAVSDYCLRDGSTGIHAIGQLRATYSMDLPAFLISGDTSGGAQREAETEGMHLLTKPVTPLKLRALLSQLLKGRRAGAHPRAVS